jgi:hypothetical protein
MRSGWLESHQRPRRPRRRALAPELHPEGRLRAREWKPRGARSSSRWNRTIARTGMSRRGAQHGLPLELRSAGIGGGNRAFGCMESATGIEPAFSVGETEVLTIIRRRQGGLAREPRASVTGIEPVFPVGKTGVLGRCTTRTSGGIGWTRTNYHPVNNRPLFRLSFDPRCRCVATPAAVGGPRLRSAAQCTTREQSRR